MQIPFDRSLSRSPSPNRKCFGCGGLGHFLSACPKVDPYSLSNAPPESYRDVPGKPGGPAPQNLVDHSYANNAPWEEVEHSPGSKASQKDVAHSEDNAPWEIVDPSPMDNVPGEAVDHSYVGNAPRKDVGVDPKTSGSNAPQNPVLSQNSENFKPTAIHDESTLMQIARNNQRFVLTDLEQIHCCLCRSW